MRWNEYSYRNGKELLKLLRPKVVKDLRNMLNTLKPYNHGPGGQKTIKELLTPELINRGWESEVKVDFGTDKKDKIDFMKPMVAIEMEFSKFEMFFRDFFRFMLLYERKMITAGILITYDIMAFERWPGKVDSYKSSKGHLQKLKDFLRGDYSSVITVPLWCIGVE